MSTQIFTKLTEISEKQAEILANQHNDRKLLEKHSDQLDRHSEILVRNTITVEEHHRRSLLLEAEMKRVDNDVESIKSHVSKVQDMGKGAIAILKMTAAGVGGVSTLGGLLWGAYQIAQKLGL